MFKKAAVAVMVSLLSFVAHARMGIWVCSGNKYQEQRLYNKQDIALIYLGMTPFWYESKPNVHVRNTYDNLTMNMFINIGLSYNTYDTFFKNKNRKVAYRNILYVRDDYETVKSVSSNPPAIGYIANYRFLYNYNYNIYDCQR